MATKKKVNKTQLILDAIAKNPTATPKEIAEKLKAYKISAAYVSTIKSAKKVGKKAGKKKGRKAAGRRKRRNGGGDSVSMSSLVRAKKLADELGGVEKAKALLDALGKLTG